MPPDMSGPLNFSNVDQLCASVDFAQEYPLVDLGRITFFEPFALVYLGMFLRYHSSRARRFRVVIPAEPMPRSYLATQNLWERFNFDPRTIQEERLRRFTTSTSLNDVVDVERRDGVADDIAERVLTLVRNKEVKVKAATFAELVAELVDNFAQHSGEQLAAFMLQYYPRMRRIVCAVGDCGIGIRASLASNPKHAHLAGRPHHEAALAAFEPLVSRRAEGGTGLTEVREEVLRLSGSLTLSTGNGYVRMSHGRTTYGGMAYDLPGVQIEVSVPERG